ncbi:MAG: GHKL domain-containing protein [Lachnospiraceae bacterium]|nr:GHKL domain-containing protein [Lachnospiraceae bacterium]
MKLSAFLTAFLFETVTTLPYRILGYYPFRKQLRFSALSVGILIGISQLLQSAIYAWMSGTALPQRASEISFSIVCFLIYMISIDADHWKTLFLYVFLFDFTVAVRGSAYFIEARLFYSPALVFDTPRSILINLLLLAVTIPMMVSFLARTKDLIFHTDAPALWHVIWMLPAFTTVIVMMYTSDISPESDYQFRFFFSRVLLILGMFGVYQVLLQSLDVIRHEAVMAEQASQQENLLALQRTQYSQLTRHMEETRQARHDLAQHLRIINSYLNTGSDDALREYVAHYEQSLPPDTSRSWCKNYAVNTLIHYYYEESEKSGIDFTASMNLPAQLPIGEPEFCSILGNLLENALLACREVKDIAPFIRVLAKADENRLLLTVDNTCTEAPAEKDGAFLSSRHEGYGLGTASVRTIAQKNNGSADFRYEQGMFYASVMLNLVKKGSK